MPARRTRQLLAGLLVAAALLTQVPSAAAGTPEGRKARAEVDPRGFGLALPEAPADMTQVKRLASQLGRKPDRIVWYVAWSLRSGFPAKQATTVAQYGATPVITWEPWDPTRGVAQTTYSPRSIANGRHDAYLTSWARQVRQWGKPVVLRFAHEGNGDWYPWSVGQNGTTAADYVAMWRHVVDVFRQQRATNALWQFSVNVPYFGSQPIATMFPGNRYVSEVGLNGYNWAGLIPGTSWASFTDLFAEGTAQLQALSDKPLRITETATPEGVGDKAAWIREMFERLAADDTYAGVTWFSFDKEADWRIDSSQASLDAFRTGLAGWS